MIKVSTKREFDGVASKFLDKNDTEECLEIEIGQELLNENGMLEYLKGKELGATYHHYATNKIDGNVVTLKKKSIKDFSDEVIGALEAWMKSDSAEPFIILDETISKYGLDSIENFKTTYFNRVVSVIARRTTYKGFKFKSAAEIESDTVAEITALEIRKVLVAKHKVLIFGVANKPRIKFEVMNPTPEHRYCSNEVTGKKTRTRYWTVNTTVDISIDEYWNFLGNNNIKEEEIVVDDNSISTFYGYGDSYFIVPTAAMVNKWWNYDCPTLSKCETNKAGTRNTWGMNPVWWSCVLIDSGWNSVTVDEDITEKEAKIFTKGKEDTEIFKRVEARIRVNSMREDERLQLEAEVIGFESRVRDLIAKYRHEIVRKLLVALNLEIDNDASTAENLEDINKYANTNYSFDCGYLYLAPTGEYLEKFKIYAEINQNERYKNGAFSRMEVPWNGQSATIKSIEGKIICDILKREGIEVSSWTVLD